MKKNYNTKEVTGNINELVGYYVRRSDWFDKLHANMKDRINQVGEGSEIGLELIDLLKSVDAWWDPSMEDLSNLHSQETCFNLRKYAGDKLGR